MPDAQSIEKRQAPSSERARRTVARILDGTAELLDEVGFDELTTNHIAEKAGVNVASLYKYFPNKYAVLAALAEQMRDDQVRLLSYPTTSEGDWRGELKAMLNVYLKLFVSRPGFAAMAAGMPSSPPLREIDEASLAAEAHAIADRIASYGVGGGRANREAIARVILEAARGVLPLARRAGPAERKRLMRELLRMLDTYISSYVES